MDEAINEQKYPIETFWILKSSLSSIMVITVFGLLSRIASVNTETYFYIIFFFFLVCFNLASNWLRRKYFKFYYDIQFLNVKQGIFSKQERHIPYGVIQNVILKQDLFDRIFGLASLQIENAAMGAGSHGVPVNKQGNALEIIGFKGNLTSIPGLKKENAEKLKYLLLEKAKANPVDDSQSGL